MDIGQSNSVANVSFVVGSAKKGLPFEKGELDLAYIRKRPTSAYPDLKRVVRAKGKVLGLHPGDDQGKELAELFPGLFPLTSGTPILDMIHHRLEQSRYQSATVETFSTTEYLVSPADVIKVRCFGQCPDVMEAVLETNLSDITKIFEQHASLKGLPVTYSRYIVRAIV